MLNGATARLPAGSVVALVGENGAGKTTLAKLLGWFYDPDSGAIRVDGTGPDRFDIEDCRAHTIVGFHDFVHFQLTLGESVGIGDLSRLDDTAGIDRALAPAGAADLAEDLRKARGGLQAMIADT
ncbi:ATP-binding cassette domain-containing protein, partial [Streptomyces sp. 2MCAF27]